MAVVFNVVLTNRLSSDANGLLRSRVAGELAALRVVDGRLKLEDAPDDSALDTQLWVFSGRAEVESPSSSPRKIRRAARKLEPLGGAPGRAVAISMDTQSLTHLQPDPGQVAHGRVMGGAVSFTGWFVHAGIYRVFGTFRYRGRPLRTSFVIDVNPHGARAGG